MGFSQFPKSRRQILRRLEFCGFLRFVSSKAEDAKEPPHDVRANAYVAPDEVSAVARGLSWSICSDSHAVAALPRASNAKAITPAANSYSG